MAFELPSLPYADTALEPYYSAKTFSFHHGKHHKAYVDNLNKLLPGSPFENSSLEEIILAVAGDATKAGFFNNAAQVWNHSFFWHCMKPDGGGAPSGALADKINTAFGSYEKFAEQFKAAAVGRFGSGWAWLVLDNGRLKVIKTANADLPMKHSQAALLTVDVWEHAYYVDYRNARAKYVAAVLANLVNWEFVANNLKQATVAASAR